MANSNVEDEKKVCFFQGGEDLASDSTLDAIKQKMIEFSNVKNVNFLLGAGTSSDSIPNMKKMHLEINKEITNSSILSKKSKDLYGKISQENLEDILSVLYAQKYYLKGCSAVAENKIEEVEEAELVDVEAIIKFIESEIYSKINIDLSSQLSSKSLDLYKSFYQKVALRNKDLSRVNVFTTNNDLFNEKALDNLNINYNNGFGGGLERTFNPARFNYTFSKKIDANLEKFEPLENMIYLYKLHGSISWIERRGNSLFDIQEVPTKGGEKKSDDMHVLIYPTPLKQIQSLGSPYSDLIREFQTKLAKTNSVLFIIGYSFSDPHLNNIIYQSMASNSSISVVIFGEYKDCPLVKINDSRIYRIYGQTELGEKVHYFEYIVNKLLPNFDENRDQKLLEAFLSAFKDVSEDGSKQ